MENQAAGRLVDLLLRQVAGAGKAEIATAVKLHLWQMVLAVLATLAAAVGLIFAAALWVNCLADRMSFNEAVGWVAGSLFLAAAFLGLAAYFLPRCRRRAPAGRTGDSEAGDSIRDLPDVVYLLAKEVPRLIEEHPAKSILAALAAGLLVGYSPEVRSLLMEALKGGDRKQP